MPGANCSDNEINLCWKNKFYLLPHCFCWKIILSGIHLYFHQGQSFHFSLLGFLFLHLKIFLLTPNSLSLSLLGLLIIMWLLQSLWVEINLSFSWNTHCRFVKLLHWNWMMQISFFPLKSIAVEANNQNNE